MTILNLIKDLTPAVESYPIIQYIISGLIGSVICIFLTVLINSSLEERFQSFMVTKLHFLKINWGHKLSGKWTQRWHVNSLNFDSINETKSVEIKQFRNRIFAQYDVLDKNGKTYTYQMFGKVDKDMVITGVWKDIKSGNRYHGCFQLYIDINEQNLNGFWTGTSKDKNIKSDCWEWIRE